MEGTIGINSELFQVPLKELHLAPPLIIHLDTTIDEAVKKMQNHHKGTLLVEKNDKLLGILTEWDILMKVTAVHDDLDIVTASKIMTYSPILVHDTDPVSLAISLMNQKDFRNVPIINQNEKAVGLVSLKDLFQHFVKLLPSELFDHSIDDDIPDYRYL